MSHRRTLCGVPVYVLLGGASESAPYFNKIESALALVATHDPVRFRRIREGFDLIAVGLSGPNIAAYLYRQRTCRLRRDFVIAPATLATELAMVLVHEATHALHHSRGIHYVEPVRMRLERLCTSAAIALARRLPEWPADVVRRMRRNVNRPIGFWSDRSIVQRRAQAYRDSGIPTLVVHCLARCELRRLKAERLRISGRADKATSAGHFA